MNDERINELSSFIENFKEFGFGGLKKEAGDEHSKIVEAVLATGLMGKLTINIDYKLTGANEIEVFYKVTSKVPKRRESMKMYADHRGMFPDNPDQLTFDNVKQITDKPKKAKEA